MSEVVYINLTNTPVAITDERGHSVVLIANKAVKGEYFARWAQPKGPLSMMHASLVDPAAIVYEAKPAFDIDEKRWAEVKAKVDPILFVPEDISVPEEKVEPETPAVETKEEVVAATEEAPAPAVATTESDQTTKTKKRKK